MGSAVISICGGGCWHHFVVIIRFRCHLFLLSFVAVHCSLLSIFILVSHIFLSHFALLAWRLVMGDVDGGAVTLVGWVGGQSRLVVGVGGFRGCWLLLAGLLCPLCIFVAIVRRLWYHVGQLLSFLDTWNHLTRWQL